MCTSTWNTRVRSRPTYLPWNKTDGTWNTERARWSKLLLTLRANIYLFLLPRPLHFQLISTFFFPTSILHSLALSIPGPSLSHLSSKTDRWLGINTTRMRWETIGRMRRTRDGEAIFAPDDAQTLRSPGKLYLNFSLSLVSPAESRLRMRERLNQRFRIYLFGGLRCVSSRPAVDRGLSTNYSSRKL